jgi:bifunctional UDP-N-acetylglucosamine pyrophosphorylase/glucosamine-1-phosphate N-acetyltransferase
LALSVLVLAAGQGKRMRSGVPKALQPLAGRPLLAHVLETARALEPAAIHVVYGHGGESVRRALPDADVRWSEQAEQLGTGHAVAQALPGIPDVHRVLVLCADTPLVTPATLGRLLADTGPSAVALLTAIVEDPTGYGRVVRDEAGAVNAVVEERDASPAERGLREINTGVMVVKADRLRRWVAALDNDNAQGEYYLTDVIRMAFSEGGLVRGVVAETAEEVLGINTKAQLAAAERALQRRRAEDLMSRGATLADPERVDIRGSVAIGRDVFIDVGVVLEGRVELGDRVRIGPYAVICDSRLGEDCVVHAHTSLDGVLAGRGCELGPFARLRPGAELAQKVKVGNFVEVKNSGIAEGAKMNHLSYVGDSSVGRDVNIGAGTITCNYDGAAKYRTKIGDEAFIGSGVMLVAPVEIGAGATIAAGSTITRDAPAGELTIARSRQTSIQGWKRPRKDETAGPGEDKRGKPPSGER